MAYQRYYSFSSAWGLGWATLAKAWLPLFLISQCAMLPGMILGLIFADEAMLVPEGDLARLQTSLTRVIAFSLVSSYLVTYPLFYGGVYASSRVTAGRFAIRDVLVCHRHFSRHLLASILTTVLGLLTLAAGIVLLVFWNSIVGIPPNLDEAAWADLKYLLLGLVPITIGLGCIATGYVFVPLTAVDPAFGPSGLGEALVRNWAATRGSRQGLFWFGAINSLLYLIPGVGLFLIHDADPFVFLTAIEPWIPPQSACMLLGNLLSGPIYFAMWGAAYRLVMADAPIRGPY